MQPRNPERDRSTTVRFRAASNIDSQPPMGVVSHPLHICSGLSAAGSLLVQFTSLSTSYWVLELTTKGLVHSGLWKVCMNPECTIYQFNLLAPHIHVTRGFLLIACFCGLLALLCVCISFEHLEICHVSLVKVAALCIFSGGLFILIGMSVFTAVVRSSDSYTNYLLIFGSSYSLSWASLPMYAMTGFLLVMTHKTIVCELWVVQ